MSMMDGLKRLRELLERAERGENATAAKEDVADWQAMARLGLIEYGYWYTIGVHMRPAGTTLMEALRDSQRLDALEKQPWISWDPDKRMWQTYHAVQPTLRQCADQEIWADETVTEGLAQEEQA